MRSDRHRHLINGLAVVIALNLCGAMATISARHDDRPVSRVAAGIIEAPSPLSAGQFSNRRTTPTVPSTTTTAALATTTTVRARPTSTTVTVPKAVTPTTRRVRVRSSTTTTRAGAAAPGPSAPAAPAAPAVTPTTAASAKAPPIRVGDAAGDTFVSGTDAPLAEPRADITEAAAAYGAGDIAFTLQVAQPVDPRTDKGWAAKKTQAVWSVDIDGDTIADYDVRYLLVADDTTGENALTGFVTWLGKDRRPSCPIAASYDADGYKALVKPGCLGDPASFVFRASVDYQPGKKAEVAGDVAPDAGFSAAVRRP